MTRLPDGLPRKLGDRLARLYGEDKAPRLIHRMSVLVKRYELILCEAPRRDGPRWDQRDSLLIAYGDMVCASGERPLVTLRRFLSQRLKNSIRSLHLLPVFPYSSAAGFAVIDYRKVNPALGYWEDVRALGEEFDLMFDLVLNHCSSESEWFHCFSTGIAPYREYFIEVDPETDLSAVSRPCRGPLLTPVQTPAGIRHVWTTFGADQIDLDFANQDVLFEFLDILLFYVQNGARFIRLDAIAYVWKELGTSCVNLPQTHEVVKLLRDVVDMLDRCALLIADTNLPQDQRLSYLGAGEQAHMVYQDSLPPLLLHALQTGTTQFLVQWARALPSLPSGCTFLNFTACHDGIDVRSLGEVVPEAEFWQLIEGIRQRGERVSSFNGSDGCKQPYELNITWYDALADLRYPDSDQQVARLLCSQVVMLALKGIPAVYFHTLTATHNDYMDVARTGQAGAINRKRWTEGELNALLDDPSTVTSLVFHETVRLLRLRAEQPAFHPDGAQEVLTLEDGLFGIVRVSPDARQRIVCVSNLSSQTREFGLETIAKNYADEDDPWFELIEGAPVMGSGTARRTLEPYASVWLTPGQYG